MKYRYKITNMETGEWFYTNDHARAHALSYEVDKWDVELLNDHYDYMVGGKTFRYI